MLRLREASGAGMDPPQTLRPGQASGFESIPSSMRNVAAVHNEFSRQVTLK